MKDDFSVSTATLRALGRAVADGIRVVVATARTPAGVEVLGDLARHVDLAVCCTGAIGYRPATSEVLWRLTLDEARVGAIVERAAHLGAGVAGFDGAVWRMTAEYHRLSPDTPQGPPRLVVEAKDLVGSSTCTMALRHGSLPADRLAQELAVVCSSVGLASVGGASIIDISPAGVDKGSGLSQALDTLGIPAEATIAFGDMPNDLPMFRRVGWSYAMGNAHADLIRQSNQVIASVDSDGFAATVDRLAAAGWWIG